MYVRYQSYDSRDALEEGIRKTNPYKIDIGAIFSVKVSSDIILCQVEIAVVEDTLSYLY